MIVISPRNVRIAYYLECPICHNDIELEDNDFFWTNNTKIKNYRVCYILCLSCNNKLKVYNPIKE